MGHPADTARPHREPRIWCRFVPKLERSCFNALKSYIDRYNPSNIGILEDYLYHQIRSREYDCLANLAILKLFALFSIVRDILNLSFFFKVSVQSRPI